MSASKSLSDKELAQRRANVKVMAKKRRAIKKCKRGHSLTDPKNVYIHGGRRHCLTCKIDRKWYSMRGLKYQ